VEGVESVGGARLALRYQPKTPAATTRTIVPRLNKTVCTLDVAGRGLAGAMFDAGSSCSGVTGERCVPSMERKRSRKEPWECEEWRLSMSEMRGGMISWPLPLPLPLAYEVPLVWADSRGERSEGVEVALEPASPGFL